MHTPGPWTIHEEPRREFPSGDVDEGGYRIDGPDIQQLAFCWREMQRWGTDHDMFGANEAEANAFLISAAPDLLRALQLILPLAMGYSPEGQSPAARRTCNEWIAAAVAAIAKAEGRQP